MPGSAFSDVWLRLQPKLWTTLRGYRRRDFFFDLVAGLTVGLVALPMAMAFGIASGVTPQAGLYTAIVGGFLVSFLGGSKLQIGGPTGAFVVIVAGILARHGLSGLYMVTMMAGVILLFLGVTGLGAAVRFIPRPIVIGFTNGIALLIASTQIKDFFGLKMDGNPSEFFDRMKAVAMDFSTLNPAACGLALGSLALIIVVPKLFPKVPGSIVALLAGTAAATLLHLPVETIGSKFGGIGLTQSFALELVEDGIKVNSICPGNFLDGPLWSDPRNGLFVQYLQTGKVPGAKTVDDVRRFYESKVPMGRGCTTADVMKAIYYLIEQAYETGQALPVTGGQVMLH